MTKDAVYNELDRVCIPVTERSVLVYNCISKSRSTLLRNLSRRALAEDLFYNRTETDFLYQERGTVRPSDVPSGPIEYALSPFSTAYFPSASFWAAFPLKKEALLSEQYYAVYDANDAYSAHEYFADRPPENIQLLMLLASDNCAGSFNPKACSQSRLWPTSSLSFPCPCCSCCRCSPRCLIGCTCLNRCTVWATSNAFVRAFVALRRQRTPSSWTCINASIGRPSGRHFI